MTKKQADFFEGITTSPSGKEALSCGKTFSPNANKVLSSNSDSKDLTLRSVFPRYKDIGTVQREIEASPHLSSIFHSWDSFRQKEFLDFCCGNRGIRILYDSFFKYVFDPDAGHKELSRLISILLGQDVRSLRILPNESHLGSDYTLVIMDIIVETSDGSVVNVEVQKIGYMFPGERAACYNADLLLRQYQRVRKEYSSDNISDANSGKNQSSDPDRSGTEVKFNYKYIRPVFTIVFMEKSTKEFHRFPDHYIHAFRQTSDSGLELNLLQNFLFVPLDIFKRHFTERITAVPQKSLTEKEAWLAFLSSDDPQVILRLLEQYPDIFRPLYDRICTMCRNTEEMMNMFSKELSILDKNTTIMMIEEQRETIEQQNQVIEQKDETISLQGRVISQQNKDLSQKDETIQQQNQEIERLRKELEEARRAKA